MNRHIGIILAIFLSSCTHHGIATRDDTPSIPPDLVGGWLNSDDPHTYTVIFLTSEGRGVTYSSAEHTVIGLVFYASSYDPANLTLSLKYYTEPGDAPPEEAGSNTVDLRYDQTNQTLTMEATPFIRPELGGGATFSRRSRNIPDYIRSDLDQWDALHPNGIPEAKTE